MKAHRSAHMPCHDYSVDAINILSRRRRLRSLPENGLSFHASISTDVTMMPAQTPGYYASVTDPCHVQNIQPFDMPYLRCRSGVRDGRHAERQRTPPIEMPKNRILWSYLRQLLQHITCLNATAIFSPATESFRHAFAAPVRFCRCLVNIDATIFFPPCYARPPPDR